MKSAGLSLILLLGPLFGQSPSVVTSIGYAPPEPIAAAPGQIITLFVRTRTSLAQPLTATALPLPTTLGGFQVLLSQSLINVPFAVPILSVRPVDTCSTVAPAACTGRTAISVQIPFELIPNVTGSRLPENSATLIVSENGESGEPVVLAPVSDRIHIVNSCDTALNAPSGPCYPSVLHADGGPVSAERPAVAGEPIIIQAFGLGLTGERVQTGAPAPSPALAVSGVVIDFRFGVDAATTRPKDTAVPAATELVPGGIGVYRVSFPAPAAPAGTPQCSAVTNNVLAVIGRGTSFDSVRFCLQVDATPGRLQEVRPRIQP